MSYMQAKIERAVKDMSQRGVSNFADSYLKDDGCIAICSATHRAPGLTTLDLSGNDIRVRGANAIADMLGKATPIKTLRLNWNHLGVANGLHQISTSMAHNRWNNILDSGAQSILDGLSRNHTIKSIPLAGNKISVHLMDAIKKALKRNLEEERRKEAISDAQKLVAEELALKDLKLPENSTDRKSPPPTPFWGLGNRVPESRLGEVEGELIDRMARHHVRAEKEMKRMRVELAQERTKADELAQKLEAEMAIRETIEREAEGKLRSSVSEKLELSEHVISQSQKLDQERKERHEASRKLALAKEQLSHLSEQIRILDETHRTQEAASQTTIDDLRTQLRGLHVEFERATTGFEDRAVRLERVAKHEIEMREAERASEARNRETVDRKHNEEILHLRDKYNGQLKSLTDDRNQIQRDLTDTRAALRDLKQTYMDEKGQHESNLKRAEAKARDQERDKYSAELFRLKSRIDPLESSRDEAQSLANRRESECKRLRADIERERQISKGRLDDALTRLAEAERELSNAKSEALMYRERAQSLEGEVDRVAKKAAAREKEMKDAHEKHQKTARQLLEDSRRLHETELKDREDKIRELEEHVKMFDELHAEIIEKGERFKGALTKMDKARQTRPRPAAGT
ncbi:hypothetical protein AAMO2058_000959900 [Amorphochlora amoebiformis]